MAVDTLQIHHATTTSLAGLRDLMSAGGRQVSANAAMGNDGHLMSVVDIGRRAFTSATAYDHRSYTVEVCNTTLAPEWGISAASHERLAILAAELHREIGLPLDREHIIGHREVPGAYATACPGPSMNLDWIASRAQQIIAGSSGTSGETVIAIVDLKVGSPAELRSFSLDTLGIIRRLDAGEVALLKSTMPSVAHKEALASPSAPINTPTADATFQKALNALNLGEFTVAQVKALTVGQSLTANRLRPSIGTGGTVPGIDVDALATALASKLPDTVTSAELKVALDALELKGTLTLT